MSSWVALQVQWLPHEDAWLAVASVSRVFIYDLTAAAHLPALTLALPEGCSQACCTFARLLSRVVSQVRPHEAHVSTGWLSPVWVLQPAILSSDAAPLTALPSCTSHRKCS